MTEGSEAERPEREAAGHPEAFYAHIDGQICVYSLQPLPQMCYIVNDFGDGLHWVRMD